MKTVKCVFSLCLALLLVLSCVPAALAADVNDAIINPDKTASLTLFKFDLVNAAKDGVWNDSSFISTGHSESYVENILGGTTRKGDANGSPDNTLGNGQSSNGYAIKGVGFTYLRVADFVTFSQGDEVTLLYSFSAKDNALLTAIGLEGGKGKYQDGPDGSWYYTSDTLNKALADALAANSTTVKDALETYVKANGGAEMPLTDENGKSRVIDLHLGLYLLVETTVPEMVTNTTNPFFVSLPMTTVSGDENSEAPEGGHAWNYDVTVYPKNETGIPTLEKTVREAQKDTGKNSGTSAITDGFAHNATGSAGDVMEYQFVSTLPTITSQATALTTYSYYDTLCGGLTYDKAAGVQVEIFTDKDCTDKVTAWDAASGKYTVTYSGDDRHMTVEVTKAGLDEINGSTENTNGKLYAGYSNYTIRVTYSATVNSDASFRYGDAGNDNKVVLTWKRTSSDYYDTLVDDCHVFSFGIDLTKLFSDLDSITADERNMFEHVKFKVWNETDSCWLTAALNDAEGVYYVTGHVDTEADATVFHPVTSDGKHGKIIIKGLEDDEYVLTEIETANGYLLLKDPIHVTITAGEADGYCGIYGQDILGVLQNDPHYEFDGGLDLHLANIPQQKLAHSLLTATATVNGNTVDMEEDNGSAHALAVLEVINHEGFNLPHTGDWGVWMFTLCGTLLIAAAILVIYEATRKREAR